MIIPEQTRADRILAFLGKERAVCIRSDAQLERGPCVYELAVE